MNSVDKVSSKRSALPLIAAWLVVALPAGWGVSQTIRKSLALFHSARPPASVGISAPGTAGR